jgi:uncharacterized membrane protein
MDQRAFVPSRLTIKRLGVVALVLGLSAPAQAGWKRVTKTSEGIVVDVRKIDGQAIVTVRGSWTAPQSPARLWKAVNDLERYTDFMPYLETAKVLKREGASTWQYYCLDTPVISDRDYTLKLTKQPNPGKGGRYEVSWVSANDAGPKEKPGKVRVKVTTGSWLLEAREGGKKTKITYTVRSDPGGSIPSWVANRANRKAVPDVMRALLKQSKKSRYQ